MEPFEKLKDRLDDALEQIEFSLDTKLQNRENIDSLESLITANSDLKRQIDNLKDELKNSTNNEIEQKDFQSLNAELVNLRAEREEEKKELQSLYDQLSAALSGSGEEV
jgi:alanyl-tRNA synthetase